jgi:phage shock protein PspC (stress-responsive transcriptional regulator)
VPKLGRSPKKLRKMRKFYRSKSDEEIFGVCSGLARYTNTDVALWRIGFLASLLTTLPGILFYCIVAIATESIDFTK